MSVSTYNMDAEPRGQPKNSEVCKPLRLDPARSLEPARKKLTTLETQRVMGVLSESFRKAEILFALPQITDRLDEFSIVFGRDLVAAIKAHAVLVNQYEDVSAKLDVIYDRKPKEAAPVVLDENFWDTDTAVDDTLRSGSQVTESKDELLLQKDELEADCARLIPELQSSVRNVIREFRKNPAAVTAVSHSDKIKLSPDSSSLLQHLEKMKNIMVVKLMTTPSEKQEKLAYLHEMKERERQNTVVIKKLEDELNSAVNDRDAEIKTRNDIIRKIQADIHHIEKYSEESMKRVRAESDKQQATDRKNSEGRIHKLTQERNQLRNQLDSMISSHRDNEQQLRGKKFKLETEIENVISKYDYEMNDRQVQYEEIDAAYTEEKKQLQELDERFKTLKEEYDQIMEEREIAREKREAAEREMQAMISAATTIQSFWRSYKIRKTLRGKKKKGGGGKKKKK